MVFAREFAIRCANILYGGVARHTQQFVIILFGSRCHNGAKLIPNLIERTNVGAGPIFILMDPPLRSSDSAH